MKVFAFLQINSFEISLIAGKFLSGGKRKGKDRRDRRRDTKIIFNLQTLICVRDGERERRLMLCCNQ